MNAEQEFAALKNERLESGIKPQAETRGSGAPNEADNTRDFSCKFFKKEFFDNIHENDLDLDNANSRISKLTEIYKDITDFYVKDGIDLDNAMNLIGVKRSRTGIIPIENISKTILKIIENSCIKKDLPNSNKCLAIRSPLGSYKNVLLQYIYLIIENSAKKIEAWKDILPFYINLAVYEDYSFNHSIEETKQYLFDDVSTLLSIIKKNNSQLPLLIIDGIREFDCGINYLYNVLGKSIKDNLNDYRLVVGVDEDYIKVKERIIDNSLIDANVFYDISSNKVYEIVDGEKRDSDYEFTLKISSMKLDRTDECKLFIKNCINFAGDKFKISARSDAEIDSLWNKLSNLGFISLDAYWLVKLLQSNAFDKSNKLLSIYKGLLDDELGRGEYDNAAKLAYEYGCDGEAPKLTDESWKFIRKHSSLLDFLVAKHYANKLKNFSCDLKLSEEEQKSKLSFFNKIFPKKIIIFAVDEIINSQECISNLFLIADNFFKKEVLGAYGQNALVFWLGRFVKDEDKVRAKALLDRFLKELDAKKAISNEDNILLRSIYVSLIYLKDKSALKKYLELLINDKKANEINRAFHLEYYGDTFPTMERSGEHEFSFEDRRSNNPALHNDPKYNSLLKGVNTLRRLARDTDTKDYSCVSILQLMTYCNIIQSRKPERENDPLVINLITDINHYKTCKDRIDVFFKNKSWETELGPDVMLYFDWIAKEMEIAESSDKYCTHVETRIYGDFHKIVNVKRTGWVQRQLPFTESVAEHMYNCWLLAFTFLPDELKSEKGYNKSLILNMLLIHDLGEVSTGDIPREIKMAETSRRFAVAENKALYPLLLIDTYPFVETKMRDFRYEWVTHWNNNVENNDINYKIAKDIDNIQAVYQYCKYYNKIFHSAGSGYEFKEKDVFKIRNGDENYADNSPYVDYIELNITDCIGWLTTLARDNITDEEWGLINKEIKKKIYFDLCQNRGLVRQSSILSKQGQFISKNLIFDNPEFNDIFSDIELYFKSDDKTNEKN